MANQTNQIGIDFNKVFMYFYGNRNPHPAEDTERVATSLGLRPTDLSAARLKLVKDGYLIEEDMMKSIRIMLLVEIGFITCR
ncbi:hypothetical protein [Flaviaesturariibacter amylovorans]|uniref:Uncharacterized protein n=1 Tax=Flaviaesturariibacter amylovorans TaxID=1084520 RepID=A0ABP8GKT7_9BACT